MNLSRLFAFVAALLMALSVGPHSAVDADVHLAPSIDADDQLPFRNVDCYTKDNGPYAGSRQACAISVQVPPKPYAFTFSNSHSSNHEVTVSILYYDACTPHRGPRRSDAYLVLRRSDSESSQRFSFTTACGASILRYINIPAAKSVSFYRETVGATVNFILDYTDATSTHSEPFGDVQTINVRVDRP